MMDFYLDGQLVDPATNWKDVSSTLRKDKDLNLFLLFQEYDLTFADSGYDYLIGKINGPGFCTQVDVEIRRDCGSEMKTIFRGILFIADCTVNEKTCTIKVKVNDRSFFSKINNNKSIKTAIDAPLTKNGLALAPVEIYDLELFRVTNNTTVRTVQACRVEEAFRYLIEFMTDGDIGFVSDTFGASGDWNGLSICTGFRLRGGPTNDILNRWIPFSFIQLFREVNKRIPLVLLVEDPYQNPIVRIESIEYLYGQQVNFFADDINEIETSFDDSKLYAIVKFGSPTDDTNTGNFPENINFLGYRNEEFHLLGECNIDRTLDLTADWVVSSNVMDRVIDIILDQGYDKNLFLITTEYTDDFTGRTTNDDFLAQVPPRYHYNALLNNASIADRYIDDLSTSIAAYYIDSRDGEALGYQTVDQSITGPTFVAAYPDVLVLPAESYDFGGFFDTALSRFVAIEPAVFNIEAKITAKYIGAGPNQNQGLLKFLLRHYDTGGTLKQQFDLFNSANTFFSGISLFTGNNITGYTLAVPGFGAGRAMTLNGSNAIVSINMAQNDYLTLETDYIPFTPDGITISGINIDSLAGANNTYIKCVNSSLVGGRFLNVDSEQFKVRLHKFSYPMTQTSFDAILANPIGRIGFAMDGQAYRYGWINELKYNHTSGLANFVLASSKESENAS
jgi:hypothetical protein